MAAVVVILLVVAATVTIAAGEVLSSFIGGLLFEEGSFGTETRLDELEVEEDAGEDGLFALALLLLVKVIE